MTAQRSLAFQIGLVTCLLGSILLMGCYSRTAGTRVTSYPSYQLTEQSRLVSDRLRVIECLTGRVNGLLQVQIRAENVTRKDLELEYRVKWLDQDAYEVKTPLSAWNSAYCIAGDTIRMQAVAPKEDAQDWELLVRFPDRW
jgi:uncharacterized protein YcfL